MFFFARRGKALLRSREREDNSGEWKRLANFIRVIDKRAGNFRQAIAKGAKIKHEKLPVRIIKSVREVFLQ